MRLHLSGKSSTQEKLSKKKKVPGSKHQTNKLVLFKKYLIRIIRFIQSSSVVFIEYRYKSNTANMILNYCQFIFFPCSMILGDFFMIFAAFCLPLAYYFENLVDSMASIIYTTKSSRSAF